TPPTRPALEMPVEEVGAEDPAPRPARSDRAESPRVHRNVQSFAASRHVIADAFAPAGPAPAPTSAQAPNRVTGEATESPETAQSDLTVEVEAENNVQVGRDVEVEPAAPRRPEMLVARPRPWMHAARRVSTPAAMPAETAQTTPTPTA